jgi:hypothetical protein
MSFGNKENLEVKKSTFVPKNIQPGVNKCKILRISVKEKTHYKTKQACLQLTFVMEGERPNAEFEGFYIDKNNPKLGRHDGPTGYVNASPFDFEDNKVEDKVNGGYVAKEMLLARFLQRVCQTLNGSDWVAQNMGVHKTFEDFIDAFNKNNPVKDVYGYFVIQGEKHLKDNGYAEYKWLAITFADKADRALGLSAFSTDATKLIAFNPAKHVRDKTGGTAVQSFSATAAPATPVQEEEAPTFKEESDIDFNTPTESASDDDVFAVEGASESSDDDIDDVFNVE